MLDRAFRYAFRNFSTLFLMVALFTVPFHLAYGYAFRNVIEVSEIHSSIETFPNYRLVKGVGPTQLRTARTAYLVLCALELALLPLLTRATRRVIEIDEQEGVPTILGTLAFAFRRGQAGLAAALRSSVGTVVAGALAAILLGWLVERSGLLIVEPVTGPWKWAPVALVQALSRAIAAPFVLAALGLSALVVKEGGSRTPTT